MLKKTTNVIASELNYDKYDNTVYDDDIRRSIPGYEIMHNKLDEFIAKFSKTTPILKMLELGIGTGISSERILKILPNASLVAVDFSEQMMNGAKDRLKNYKVEYLLGDYSEVTFDKDFDLIVSIISIHHQSTAGKKELFKKIYESLNHGGVFIFGDIVTTIDKHKAAYNDAKHFHHLVENARNDKSLEEWAYHHRFLNIPEPIETQLEWLKQLKFKNIEILFEKFNTALIVAQK